MLKVCILGTSGSGKTTLGNTLSFLTNIPSYDLDEIHWLPNWQERPISEKVSLANEVTSQDSWIISGNYSQFSSQHIWPKADLFIWLDLPLSVLLYRVLKRSVRRILRKEMCCNGNFESLRLLFSKYSIFGWVLTTYVRRKRTYSKLSSEDEKWIRIRNRKELEQFLCTFTPRLKS